MMPGPEQNKNLEKPMLFNESLQKAKENQWSLPQNQKKLRKTNGFFLHLLRTASVIHGLSNVVHMRRFRMLYWPTRG